MGPLTGGPAHQGPAEVGDGARRGQVGGQGASATGVSAAHSARPLSCEVFMSLGDGERSGTGGHGAPEIGSKAWARPDGASRGAAPARQVLPPMNWRVSLEVVL
jgi:hypothetical protein